MLHLRVDSLPADDLCPLHAQLLRGLCLSTAASWTLDGSVVPTTYRTCMVMGIEAAECGQAQCCGVLSSDERYSFGPSYTQTFEATIDKSLS